MNRYTEDKLEKLVIEMDDEDVLEDRREYSEEDLKLAYELTDEESSELHKMIQAYFDPASCKFESYFKNLPKAELGGLMKEYVAESNHNSWDGWTLREQMIVSRFLNDVMLYHENGKDQGKFGERIDSVNPVP